MGPDAVGAGGIWQVTRYTADAVVTFDAVGRILTPGVVDVAGDRIVFVGPPDEAPEHHGMVRALEGLVMPGLVNAHGHSAMTLLRGAGDGLPLDRWLTEVIWPQEAHLDDEDVYWGMVLGANELLLAGVTTTCEMYVLDRAVVQGALDAGLRCVVTPGILDPPGPAGGWRAFLDRALALHAEVEGLDGRISVGLGPHSVYALPEEALEAVAEAASQLRSLVHIHLAETKKEVDDVRARYGCTPSAMLERVGILEHRCLAAHSVWLDDRDLERYADRSIAVAHCPGSNAKLGSGMARLADLLEAGITVGLGTDGPASSDDLDVLHQARLAACLARAKAAQPDAVATAQVLELATAGGADALGVDAGRLETGRLADFIRLDLDDTRFVPTNDPSQLVSHLLWSVDGSAVRDVWVGGAPGGGWTQLPDRRRPEGP